jgi:quercetin dioxygenase-like cupin family protein
MKRSAFITATLSALAGITAPILATARRLVHSDAGKGFVVLANKDRHDKPMSLFEGDKFYTKISADDTNGNLYVLESTRDKQGGPPLHLHPEQDEWWYVMEGEFLIKVGDQLYNAKPGDSVFGPRNVPHTFAKVNDGNARIMIVFQPAGKMEANFRGVSDGLTKGMTVEQRNEYSKTHGVIVVGPPLGNLKR